MDTTMDDLFEVSLNDLMTDISLDAIAEDVIELDEIERCFTEADDICQLFNDMEFGIYEDVVVKGGNSRKEHRRQVKEVQKRTGSVAKNGIRTIGNVTKIGGNLIFAGYSMITKLVDLVVKVVKTVSEKLIVLPNAIGGLIDKAGKIVPRIKSKIKGHLIIHIRPDDIASLYNDNLFVICDKIIAQGLVMAEGDTWVTRIKDFQASDVRIAKRMQAYYKKLGDIDFTEYTVNMNDKNNVHKYFGNEPYIRIKTNGTEAKYTYFQALQKVANDLKLRQKNIRAISEQLDKKLSKTQASQQFGRLSEKKQDLIRESVQYVSKSILLIEKLGKYIIRDINTVNNFIRECIENTKKTAHKDEIRKNINADQDAYKLNDPDKVGPKPKDRAKRKEWRAKMRAKKASEKADFTKGKNKEIKGRSSVWSDWESFIGDKNGY